MANARKFGRTPNFLIADGTSTEGDGQACRRLIAKLFRNSGFHAEYLGLHQKLSLACALTEKGKLPEDVVRFALSGSPFRGPAIGANRNAVLLRTLGTTLLSVDDDTVCEPATVPGQQPESLFLGAESELGEFWFFPDRRSALRFVKVHDVDIVSAHEQMLGSSVQQIVRQASESGTVNLERMCIHLFQSIYSGRGSIRVTINGAVGDSGMHSNMFIRLRASEATRRRLIEREGFDCGGSFPREIIRQTMGSMITHPEPLMTMFIGLDNRELLPPFFPVYRNEDGLFAHVLAQCDDQSYCGHIPWLLIHSPADARSYGYASLRSIRVSDVIMACLLSWTGKRVGKPASDQLLCMGQHLIDLGSLEQGDFDETIHSFLWQRASSLIRRIEAMRAQYARDGCGYAARELNQQTQALEQAVIDPEYALPADLIGVVAKAEIPRILKTMVKQFGELLSWWPLICERSMQLSASGRTFGEIIE